MIYDDDDDDDDEGDDGMNGSRGAVFLRYHVVGGDLLEVLILGFRAAWAWPVAPATGAAVPEPAELLRHCL